MDFAKKCEVQFYRHCRVPGYTIELHDTPAETPKTHEYF